MSDRKKKYSDETEEDIPYTNENIAPNYQYQEENNQNTVPYYSDMRYEDRFQTSYQDEYNYRYNAYHDPQRNYDQRYDTRTMQYPQEYASAYERPGGMVHHDMVKPRIEDESPDLDSTGVKKGTKTGRKKIKMAYIEGKNKRSVTFSKRKKGIMKKAYELNMLTKSQILLLVASESGHVYTFATPKLKPIISKHENLIQQCLNAPSSPEKPKYIPEIDDQAGMHDPDRHGYGHGPRSDYYDGYDQPSGRDYQMDDRK
ncbi:Regulator of arginine metabolism, MADS box-containing transcription factor [Pseudoloma neurophilia]|uniref:Regulator of arginine metabolism, MADS box-containing transcription factor n=1 Tax=Pseudoloma neurophilia TaxID=146866 RepID=A0A0R0M8F2_9MICR|nr:Regulator of arginine metabolism, MADS box-containing transcription factor [Pseudoloma neurophilia]